MLEYQMNATKFGVNVHGSQRNKFLAQINSQNES